MTEEHLTDPSMLPMDEQVQINDFAEEIIKLAKVHLSHEKIPDQINATFLVAAMGEVMACLALGLQHPEELLDLFITSYNNLILRSTEEPSVTETIN